MNKEVQRTAIAEACGWSYRKTEFCTYWWNDEVNKTLPPNDDGFRPCPDYLNDLNAMHEAEKMLKGGMRSKYDAELTLICIRDYNFIWESTASQRAEAFLRTIGKFKEAKL